MESSFAFETAEFPEVYWYLKPDGQSEFYDPSTDRPVSFHASTSDSISFLDLSPGSDDNFHFKSLQGENEQEFSNKVFDPSLDYSFPALDNAAGWNNFFSEFVDQESQDLVTESEELLHSLPKSEQPLTEAPTKLNTWELSPCSSSSSSTLSSSISSCHSLELKNPLLLPNSPIPVACSPTTWLELEQSPNQLELIIPVLTPRSSPKRSHFSTGEEGQDLSVGISSTNNYCSPKRHCTDMTSTVAGNKPSVSFFHNFEVERSDYAKLNKTKPMASEVCEPALSFISHRDVGIKDQCAFDTIPAAKAAIHKSLRYVSSKNVFSSTEMSLGPPTTAVIHIGSEDFSVTENQLRLLRLLVKSHLREENTSPIKLIDMMRPELTDKVLEYGLPFKSIQSREDQACIKLPNRESYTADGVSYLGAEPVDNLYDPVFIRRLPSDEDNCGWCDVCGVWLQLRNHTYAHHFKSLHGISQRSKSTVRLPRIIRGEAGDDKKMQGFCEPCGVWIDLHHRRDGKRWQTWYIHQFQAHHKDEEPNENPRPKIEIDERITELLRGFLDNCC
jgi:hypothetical protein